MITREKFVRYFPSCVDPRVLHILEFKSNRVDCSLCGAWALQIGHYIQVGYTSVPGPEPEKLEGLAAWAALLDVGPIEVCTCDLTGPNCWLGCRCGSKD